MPESIDTDPCAVRVTVAVMFACVLPPGHDGPHQGVCQSRSENDEPFLAHVWWLPPGAGGEAVLRAFLAATDNERINT